MEDMNSFTRNGEIFILLYLQTSIFCTERSLAQNGPSPVPLTLDLVGTQTFLNLKEGSRV